VYSLDDYGWMVTDRARMGAYEQAIAQSVRAGDVVADVGAGLGVFAMLACRAGARKVYAIEPADVVHVARRIARDNGFNERIEFIQGLSTEVNLPEKVDAIVADLGGQFCLFESIVPTIVDMRTRLLKPNGITIPRRYTMWAAPIYAPDTFAKYLDPWRENAFGLDLSAGIEDTQDRPCSIELDPTQLLAEPVVWGELDFANVTSPDFCETLDFAPHDGRVHGIALWFDSELTDSIVIRGSPRETERSFCYRTRFFPLRSPIDVRRGDRIVVDLRADLVDGDYLWRWNTRVLRDSEQKEVASFVQSTFMSSALSADAIAKNSADYAMQTNEPGEELAFALSLVVQGVHVGELATALAARYPGRYANARKALAKAAEISSIYSR
jgi:type I protein arginine methyltransferase